MTLQRGMDDQDPIRPERVGRLAEERRASSRLAVGTLACPLCDAPVALTAARMGPADPIGCPYCGHAGAVRDFLSLESPSRPAHVEVRVVLPATR
jgi:hypothetical protein